MNVQLWEKLARRRGYDSWLEREKTDEGDNLYGTGHVWKTVAALRREDVPRAEIIARLQRGDVVIETTPSPQQTTPNDGEGQKAGQGDALAVMVVRSDLQRQIDALARTQSTLLRAAVLWGALWGAVAALVFAAFVVWVLWLVVAY